MFSSISLFTTAFMKQIFLLLHFIYFILYIYLFFYIFSSFFRVYDIYPCAFRRTHFAGAYFAVAHFAVGHFTVKQFGAVIFFLFLSLFLSFFVKRGSALFFLTLWLSFSPEGFLKPLYYRNKTKKYLEKTPSAIMNSI